MTGKRAESSEAFRDSSLPSKQPRVAGVSSKRARIVVVGAGSWSQGWHLPQLNRNSDAEIAAIVEPAATGGWRPGLKSTKELGELYSAPIFTDIGSFLQSEIATSVDGVLIATNHASHFSIAMEVIKAGLNVMIEKPMVVDVLEAHKLADVAASYNKTVMVNNSANFREHALHAHKLVQDGQIGQVEHVSCYLMVKMHDFLNDPNNTTWTQPSGNMVGNGFAWGQLSHTLAWIYMVTNLSPANVFCHMRYSATSGADVYDSASVKCTNGATMSVQGVAELPRANKSGKLVENKVFGTDGSILYCGDDEDPVSGNLVLSRHDGKHNVLPGFFFENTDQEGDGPESLRAFVGACLGRDTFNAADVSVGLKVVQTIDAMYRSAKSGKCEDVIVSASSVQVKAASL